MFDTIVDNVDIDVFDDDDCTCDKCNVMISDMFKKLYMHFFGVEDCRVCLRVNGLFEYFTREFRSEFSYFCDAIDSLICDIIKGMVEEMILRDISVDDILTRRMSIYGFKSRHVYWYNQDNLSKLDQLVYLYDMAPEVIYDTVKLCYGAYRYGFLSEDLARKRFVCYGSKFGIEACVLKAFVQQVLRGDLGHVDPETDVYNWFFSRDLSVNYELEDETISFVVNGNPKYNRICGDWHKTFPFFVLSIDKSRLEEEKDVKEIIIDEYQYGVYCNFGWFIRNRMSSLHGEELVIYDKVKKVIKMSPMPLCVCPKEIPIHDIVEMTSMIVNEESKSEIYENIVHHKKDCDTCLLVSDKNFGNSIKLLDGKILPKIGYRLVCKDLFKMATIIRCYNLRSVDKVATYSGESFSTWLYNRYFDRFMVRYYKPYCVTDRWNRSCMCRLSADEIQINSYMLHPMYVTRSKDGNCDDGKEVVNAFNQLKRKRKKEKY